MTGNRNSRGGHAVFPRWSEKAVSKGAWLKPVILFRHARLNRTKLPTWSNQSFQLIVWQQLTNFDCKHSHSPWVYRIVGIYVHSAKVLCILHHWGVQLILAYSWARPAILVVGKGRGGMFLFLLFLHFHSCSSFFPVPLFHLLQGSH